MRSNSTTPSCDSSSAMWRPMVSWLALARVRPAGCPGRARPGRDYGLQSKVWFKAIACLRKGHSRVVGGIHICIAGMNALLCNGACVFHNRSIPCEWSPGADPSTLASHRWRTAAYRGVDLGARGRLEPWRCHRAFAQAGWQCWPRCGPTAQRTPCLPSPGCGGCPWRSTTPPRWSPRRKGAQVVVHAQPAYPTRPGAKGTRIDGGGHCRQPPAARHADAAGRRLQLWRIHAAVLRERPRPPPVSEGMRVRLEQRILQACARGECARRGAARRGPDFSGGKAALDRPGHRQDLARGRITWPGPLDVARPGRTCPTWPARWCAWRRRRHRLAAFSACTSRATTSPRSGGCAASRPLRRSRAGCPQPARCAGGAVALALAALGPAAVAPTFAWR